MILEIKNLTKVYGGKNNKLEVLKDLNLRIETPKKIAIIGKSGSGKTTLLSLIAGLDDFSSGEIYLSGKDLSLMNEDELTLFRASEMGIIFQAFHLLSTLSALENVMLPLDILKKEGHSKELALKELENVGLLSRKDHFPHELSGGEKQRVAIARAIVSRPSIILADEPSGNLDSQTSKKVMNLLFNIIDELKRTLILVTHDDELAMRCDEAYKLKDGKLERVK